LADAARDNSNNLDRGCDGDICGAYFVGSGLDTELVCQRIDWLTRTSF
jgi:hypothetical protein